MAQVEFNYCWAAADSYTRNDRPKKSPAVDCWSLGGGTAWGRDLVIRPQRLIESTAHQEEEEEANLGVTIDLLLDERKKKKR